MKTSKLRVTGLCEGNSPVTGEFPSQRVSNAEIVPFDDVIMHDPDFAIILPVQIALHSLEDGFGKLPSQRDPYNSLLFASPTQK